MRGPSVLHLLSRFARGRLLLAAALLGNAVTLGLTPLAAQTPTPAPAAKPAPAPAAKPLAAPPAAPLVKGARLRGIVLNAEDGSPLGGADVVLVGLDTQVRAGENGRFDFGVMEPGPYIVQSRMLGFQPYTVKAQLADSSSLDLVFRMKRAPFQLQDVVVDEKKQEKRSRFYERMKESNGFGTFVTREQIEQRNTPFTCDLLRGRLGLRVIQTGSTCNIRMSRNQGASFQNADCAPTLIVDGSRSDISLLETNSLPPSSLEGVEIYRSAAEAPMEYNGAAFCGVIALWTKIGR